jgi:hypothetical protein
MTASSSTTPSFRAHAIQRFEDAEPNEGDNGAGSGGALSSIAPAPGDVAVQARRVLTMPGRLLVTYSNSSNFVSTTAEYLESIAKYCNMEVRYAHVTNGAKLDFDLNEFDAVFQSYCVRLPVDNYVSADYLEKLKAFRGVKMLAAQDEYEDTNKLKSAIKNIGYDVFFTNAAGAMIEKLYPRIEFPKTEFVTVLTGYVPEQFETRRRNIVPLRDRPIHIGYRGRRLPAYFGRLGFEKFEIGRRMREICIERGIPCDIEWTEDKRLYGEAWYDFIGSCRANLGSETGSNVFDLDGKLRARYEKLSKARGEPVPFEEFQAYTDPVEAKYDIGQLSPRLFEAAVMRTPLILFSGKYLGIIARDEHYIELKKDFSNVDEVLERLDDLGELERMADRAYDRLVGGGEFSYRGFIGLVEDTVRRKAAELHVRLREPTGRFGPTEFGVEPKGLAEYREQPTVAPRHPAFFWYQDALQQNRHYAKHVDHLNAYIEKQNKFLTEEIARLNEFYSGHIDHLNSIINRTRAASVRGIPADARRRRMTPGAVLRRLLENPAARRLGRKIMANLPDPIGKRIKSGVILLLDRF